MARRASRPAATARAGDQHGLLPDDAGDGGPAAQARAARGRRQHGPAAQRRGPREAIYWHYPHYGAGGPPGGAVRAGDYKLIEFYEDGRVELYNLREDLGERNDLAAKMPEKAAELRRMLHAWRARWGRDAPAEPGLEGLVVDKEHGSTS